MFLILGVFQKYSEMQTPSPTRRTTTGGSSHPLQALWEMYLDTGPEEVPSGVEGLHQLALQVLSVTLSITHGHRTGLSKVRH